MPFVWQARLLPYFYGGPPTQEQVFRADDDPAWAEAQRAYRAFLARLLRPVVRRHDVRLVLGAAVHYLQDVDWGAAARTVGVPYVVLHRESMITAPALLRANIERYRGLGSFQGDHLCVHNSVMRTVFAESGFARPEQISVLGVTRMDAFLRRLPPPPPSGPKRLVLFSFFHAVGLGPKAYDHFGSFQGVWSADGRSGWVRLFDGVHGAVGRVAARNPDVEFVVKTKWAGREWAERVRAAIRRAGVEPGALSNLRIQTGGHAQDLLLDAHVVTGFGSTTLLEAGVAGKPVVIPHFAECHEPSYADYVPLRDAHDGFDVARSPADYEKLLEWRIHDASVSMPAMEVRRRAFEQLVSSLDGEATRRYAALLERWASCDRG